MISTYIDIFINYLNANASFFSFYFIPILFFIALFESLPIVGIITPGTLLLMFFGFSGAGLNINLAFMVFVVTLGSIIGDMVGYFLGKYGSVFLLKHKKILKHSHIEEGKKFFSNHGFKSIFIGRFVGIMRPIVSLIAGSMHMRFSKFMFFEIMASFLWSLIYVTIGFYFGQHFREIEKFISHIGIGLFLIILLTIGIYYFIYIKYKGKIKINENQ